MMLNNKRENILITAFRLILSVIMGFVIGIGMSLAFASVVMFRIIKKLSKQLISVISIK